ncbi:hypothetical protein DX116_01690 [Aeromicrobium endophyticum]|uniref:DUF4878 domain-containing protein n=2 Tax=Aeromicrobium endophyticum TaxID=2292704 RepID=A0A371PA37_9ACTN|nr:hypothetical protein DX116_01690 [Aeromicrobium endophyticum]
MGETDVMRLLVASAALLLVAACGSGGGAGSGSPEGAVSDLMAALEKGSCTDVKSVVVTPDDIDCEMIGTLKGDYAADGVDLDAIELSADEPVDGSATVTVDLGTDEDDQTWQVQQVDGSWKVLFDSEA